MRHARQGDRNIGHQHMSQERCSMWTNRHALHQTPADCVENCGQLQALASRGAPHACTVLCCLSSNLGCMPDICSQLQPKHDRGKVREADQSLHTFRRCHSFQRDCFNSIARLINFLLLLRCTLSLCTGTETIIVCPSAVCNNAAALGRPQPQL